MIKADHLFEVSQKCRTSIPINQHFFMPIAMLYNIFILKSIKLFVTYKLFYSRYFLLNNSPSYSAPNYSSESQLPNKNEINKIIKE